MNVDSPPSDGGPTMNMGPVAAEVVASCLVVAQTDMAREGGDLALSKDALPPSLLL